jgi:excisionase family DNA binding protein
MIAPFTPSKKDSQLAAESARRIAEHLSDNTEEVRVRFADGGEEDVVTLPASAVRMLQEMLLEMSRGNSVTLIPLHAEFTTQEAADFLNVSRPYVVKLLEQGKIPYRMVGSHRRIQFQDLLRYKSESDEAAKQAVVELQRLSEELDLP